MFGLAADRFLFGFLRPRSGVPVMNANGHFAATASPFVVSATVALVRSLDQAAGKQETDCAMPLRVDFAPIGAPDVGLAPLTERTRRSGRSFC